MVVVVPSAGQTGKLSSCVTQFNPHNKKRVHNMRVALRALDGLTIKPREIFSLNRRLGKRIQSRGYRTAVVFEEGKKVPGIGGGASQVTGTLFNAALMAGLPIREYHNHSRPVPYLPVGRDATLAWDVKDLKLKNNTPAPIKLSYTIKGNRLIAALYGHQKPGKQVRISVVKRRLAKHHIVARLYRVFKQNGIVVSKELVGTSAYKWEPESPD